MWAVCGNKGGDAVDFNTVSDASLLTEQFLI